MKARSTPGGIARKTLVGIAALLTISVVNTSVAAVNAEVGGAALTGVTNFENFEGYDSFSAPPVTTPSGFTFDCDSCNFSTYFGGLDGIALYQNGGSSSMTSIKLTSGDNFDAVSMKVGNGWGPDDPQDVWVRAYHDGSPVSSFLLPGIPLAATVTVWADGGSVFDEVRIQAYQLSNGINEDEAQFGAVAIDDVTAGSTIPAASIPTLSQWALILLTALLGVAAFSRRRLTS